MCGPFLKNFMQMCTVQYFFDLGYWEKRSLSSSPPSIVGVLLNKSHGISQPKFLCIWTCKTSEMWSHVDYQFMKPCWLANYKRSRTPDELKARQHTWDPGIQLLTYIKNIYLFIYLSIYLFPNLTPSPWFHHPNIIRWTESL